MKLENLKSSFPKKRNWSESLCLKIIKVVQTTTWTKSDINPSDYSDLRRAQYVDKVKGPKWMKIKWK